ncbi:hypothetical protein LV84_00953 [Algoriphagus ratkowskyi]|uniref:Uncharacterized protein n=1 Tax=Algoriphagus ratkowskyi TaxID=57028 RepID=A0A2W7RH74_9BACT|nr:hypothetical protein LV84_00953 [Algoriphagus ratkowskyi]
MKKERGVRAPFFVSHTPRTQRVFLVLSKNTSNLKTSNLLRGPF